MDTTPPISVLLVALDKQTDGRTDY